MTVDPSRPDPIGVVLPRFVLIGILSVGVDIALLALLHSVLNVELLVSITAAYGASLVVNYSLNHVWAFDADGVSWTRLYRYGVLVVINFSLTLGLITGLTTVGVYYLVAKVVAVTIGAAVNFTGNRFWVFR